MKRKTLFFGVIATLFLAFVYLLSTQALLSYIANKVAKTYDIKYKSIKGDIFTFVEIKGVGFRDKKIADRVYLRYSFKDILDKRFHILKIKIDNLRVKNLSYLQQGLLEGKKEKKGSLSLRIDKINITVAKYNTKEFIAKDIRAVIENFILKDEIVKFDLKRLSATVVQKVSLKSLLVNASAKVEYDLKKSRLIYSAKAKFSRFQGIDKKVVKLFKDNLAILNGKNRAINIKFKSKKLKLVYLSSDLLKNADANITSKFINAKLKLDFNKEELKAHISLAKNSPLKSNIKKIGLKRLFPLDIVAIKKADVVKMDIDNSFLKLSAKYDMRSGDVDMLSTPKGGKIYIKKRANIYNYKIEIDSLRDFVKSIKPIYDIEIGKLNGEVEVDGSLENSIFKFDIRSAWLDNKEFSFKDINSSFVFKDGVLKSRGFGLSLFARGKKIDIKSGKKSSLVNFRDKKFDISLLTDFAKINLKGFLKDKTITWDTLIESKYSYKNIFKISNANISSSYMLNKRYLKAKISIKGSSIYSSLVTVNSDLDYRIGKRPSFKGDMKFVGIKGVDKRALKLLQGAYATFHSTKEGVSALCRSDLAKLSLNYNKRSNQIKATLKTNVLKLKDFVNGINQDIRLTLSAKSILNIKDLNKTLVSYKIESNVVNVDGGYSFKDRYLRGTMYLSRDSILKSVDKDFHPSRIFPVSFNLSKKREFFKIVAKNSNINANITYNSTEKKIKAYMDVYGIVAKIKGGVKRYDYDISIDSIRESMDRLRGVYNFKRADKADAKIDIKGSYGEKGYDFVLNAPWFLYRVDFDKFFFVKDTSAKLSYRQGLLKIKDYRGYAYILNRYRKLYSDKSSTIHLHKQAADITFYLNNEIKIFGKIGKKTLLKITSSTLHINEPEAKVKCRVDLKYKSEKSASSLNGKVYLLGGKISYKPQKTYQVKDKDIIFVNRVKKEKKMGKKMKILVNIISKKKMEYVEGKNRIYFKNDITLFRYKGEKLGVYGYVDILGGVYESDGKRFDIGRGKLIFDGDVLNPYLNLKAYYEKEPYKITIFVGGKLSSPILNFSSNPYLSQNDILSILIFNSKFSSITSGNKAVSTSQALSIFGNSFAKGITDSIGIKLNRVQLLTTKIGTLGFEVEKQLTKKISIVYQNNLVQSIKIRYKNSRHIETDVTIAPNSSGIELLYR